MLNAIFSILAAMFGVQSSKNSERDLSSGKFKQYIAAAILGVLFFIGSIYLLVKIVLMKNGI